MYISAPHYYIITRWEYLKTITQGDLRHIKLINEHFTYDVSKTSGRWQILTNGKKLLSVFPEAEVNEKDFVWSVGLKINGETIVISKRTWNAESKEGKNE